MTKVFIVDDEPMRAQTVEMRLQAEGCQVDGCSASQVRTLTDRVLRRLAERGEEFDILVLDIQYGDHELGGLHLYQTLQQAGLASRFGSVLVFTRHLASGSVEVRRDLFQFIENIGQPRANLLPREALEDGRLVARIREIMAERPPKVPVMGNPNEEPNDERA